MASALLRHDRRPLAWAEIVLRAGAAVLLFAPGLHTDLIGALLAFTLLGLHHLKHDPQVAD